MKKIFIVLFFSFCTSLVYSQDLIVTGEGDSINCRITRMKSGHVYFTFKHDDEYRNTLLPLTDVKDYKYSFFEVAVVPKDKIKAPINYQRFRLALNGGFSYETAKISKSVQSEFRDYVKELKSGYHLGGDVNYFFSEQLGFGAKYIRFHTTNQMDGIYVTDNGGTTTYGKMSDDIKVTFFGPSFAYRFLNQSGKNAFILNYALGYMGYRNDFVLIDPFYMKGGTVGTALDIGYDMGITKNLSLGLQLSLIGGTMSQYKLYKGSFMEKVELEQGEYESLSRIDLSIGIRYSL